MTEPPPPSIRSRLHAWFFGGELPKGPAVWLWIALAARALGLAGLRFYRERRQEKASALAYATLLALLPVLILAISLLEFLAPAQQTDLARWFVSVVFPSEAHEVRDGVIEYIEKSRDALQTSAAAGTGLRIASAVLLLYFAASLISGVDSMVGDLWGTGGVRAFVRRLTAYWAVATIGPLLLALSIVGTTLVSAYVGKSAGGFSIRVLPFAVTWISAFAFFRYMPHTGARNGAALAGAIVAGTLWEGTKLAMGWYLESPKTLLTALGFFPAAILWMYVSWLILIYGLEVTYIVHHGSWRAGRRAGGRGLTGRAREELILGTALAVASEFEAGRLPDRAELAQMLGVGEDEIARAITTLVDAGLVASDHGGEYRPARGIAGISALGVVDVARGASLLAGNAAARTFLDSIDKGGRGPVAAVSLQDLVREPPREADRAEISAADERRPVGG